MNIAIYHPNMHLMGGGETVCLTLAEDLSKKNNVDVFVTTKVDVKKYEEFFGLNLKKIKFIKFGKQISNLPSFETFKQSMYIKSAIKIFEKNYYDLIIDTSSNGIFYKPLESKTLCYVHFPNFTTKKRGIKYVLNKFLIDKKHLYNYDSIICNSEFTKKHVKKFTNKKISVIYPPVKTKIKIAKKEAIITSIGRYSQEKKHEIMIKAFIEIEKELPKYSLHIVGAYDKKRDGAYIDYLRLIAEGHRIVFHKNMNHKDVLSHLSRSQIYWHSRGFGETNPIEYENFGITTVEAMAAGCIPIVINLGAQPEIVKNGKNGYCWNTVDELENITKKVTKTNPEKIALEAIKKSKEYSTKIFLENINKKINLLMNRDEK